MKERKFLLVGPPDSGKTGSFAPFQGEYYVYFNTFRVMPSRKNLFQLRDCVFRVL